MTGAAAVPWRDATQRLLGEMRFRFMAKYLPQAEADQLVQRFDAELDRIYAQDAN